MARQISIFTFWQLWVIQKLPSFTVQVFFMLLFNIHPSCLYTLVFSIIYTISFHCFYKHPVTDRIYMKYSMSPEVKKGQDFPTKTLYFPFLWLTLYTPLILVLILDPGL